MNKQLIMKLELIFKEHDHIPETEAGWLEKIKELRDFQSSALAVLSDYDLEIFELDSTLKRGREAEKRLDGLTDGEDDIVMEIRKLENLEIFAPSEYQKGALDMAAFLRSDGDALSDKIRMGVTRVR